MKKSTKIWLSILAIIVVAILVFFGLMGYIPGVSNLLGANKPRDLGVTYTDADTVSAREKSKVTREQLSSGTPDNASIQFSGSHPVSTSWSSAEMTALLNNRPWKYWPISDVQMKINSDGTAEMSGVINADKLRGYAAGIGVPSAVSDRISLLPAGAAFYIKGVGALSENKVSKFDITSAELGRMGIPTSILLSSANVTNRAFAAGDVVGELEKYSGKKAAVVDFINGRLSWVSGFFARKAQLINEKLEFDGSLPDKELTTR